MGVKSEKKRLIKIIGGLSDPPEFNENLNDQLHYNKLSETSKKVIKNVLAKKFREFDILETEPVKYLVKNLSEFTKNITSNDLYHDCVLEIQNNNKRIKIRNLLIEIQNSTNIMRKK